VQNRRKDMPKFTPAERFHFIGKQDAGGVFAPILQ
jgi:hypothetical protein